MSQTEDPTIRHYGVRGMKWGVRKNRTGASGASGPAPKKLTKKQLAEKEAVRARRMKIGKEVVKALVVAGGAVAVGSVAGPIAASGASAIARELLKEGGPFTTSTTDRSSDSIRPTVNDGSGGLTFPRRSGESWDSYGERLSRINN